MQRLVLVMLVAIPAVFVSAFPTDMDISVNAELSYYEARDAINSYYPHHTESSPYKSVKRSTSVTRSDGAVPFWFEDGVPIIIASVGTPPQPVQVIVDTGSGVTWLQGLGSSVSNPFQPTHSTT